MVRVNAGLALIFFIFSGESYENSELEANVKELF